MAFKPPFDIGAVVSNAVLTEAFKVGNMGGMRRSKATGTLVLISDNTKGLYNDTWHEGILRYTGMGKIGDQTLKGNSNKTLAESGTNGIEVHLFEVDEPGKYSYSGVVELAGEPYQEEQPDDNGNPRQVWMFPLKKVEQSPKKAVAEMNVGSKVYTHHYGIGTVTRVQGDFITVQFDKGERLYPVDETVKNGYLTLVE